MPITAPNVEYATWAATTIWVLTMMLPGEYVQHVWEVRAVDLDRAASPLWSQNNLWLPFPERSLNVNGHSRFCSQFVAACDPSSALVSLQGRSLEWEIHI